MNILKEIESLRKEHYYCEDHWYSCPLSEDGCANENIGDSCNCGADDHNKKVEEIFSEVARMMAALL